MLERNDWLGGAIRTAEITRPGYHHDVFSAWHPLWLGGRGHALLGDDLAARGLEYLNTELPSASVADGGAASFLLRSAEANAAEFARHHPADGEAWRAFLAEFLPNADLAFALFGSELWSRAGAALLLRALRRLGRRGLHEWSGGLLVSARDWLEQTFASEEVRGLLAPWVLHTGLGPDAASSGFMAQVIGFAIQEGGMPVPRGGGARLPDALARLIADHGGECRTGVEVASVRVEGGRAAGVTTVGGEAICARRAVIANVTAHQLYERLLGAEAGPARAGARRVRSGRSEMQIHFALSEPPRWRGDERLGRSAIVHLSSGLDGVSKAVNEAERGLLPADATVVCGQPLTIDPSRAPAGAGLLWVQLQELPWRVRGDAAGEIDVGDGSWSEALREAYADRIQERLSRHVANLDAALLARTALSPADLEAANPNLEQGDPYGGSLALDQNFLWRPFPGQPGHRTPLPALWHVGASTWPGPGLGAGSGVLVAEELLRPSSGARLTRRLRRGGGDQAG